MSIRSGVLGTSGRLRSTLLGSPHLFCHEQVREERLPSSHIRVIVSGWMEGTLRNNRFLLKDPFLCLVLFLIAGRSFAICVFWVFWMIVLVRHSRYKLVRCYMVLWWLDIVIAFVVAVLLANKELCSCAQLTRWLRGTGIRDCQSLRWLWWRWR